MDADDLHTQSNRDKLTSGQPLEDADRWLWLDRVRLAIQAKQSEISRPLFLACSALKRSYRATLFEGLPRIQFIYLRGEREVLLRRLELRDNHFMPSSLLDSQLATLEEPQDAITVDVDQSEEW